MTKKVLMFAGPVHPIPPLKGAAVETWLYEVSKRLLRFEPHIVSLSHPSYPLKEYKDGIYFHRLHFSRSYKRFKKITGLDLFPYPSRVLKVIDQLKPDIIHMHNSVKWFLPIIEKVYGKDIKVLLHLHNEMEITQDIRVDYLLGCSDFIVSRYKNNGKLKAKNYLRCYNGVDLQRFKPKWEEGDIRDNIRERFNINKKDFLVLFVGRVSQEKGVEHVIKSASLLQDLPNVKFMIVGEIRKEDTYNERVKYAREMMELACTMKDKITFTDVFSPEKINLLYLLGDMIVVPSNFEEPFSMVAIEAMASGLPLITRRKGGIKEYIEDGINGLYLNENNLSNDLADKIRLMLTDISLRETLMRNGRKTVEERFSWDKIAFDLEKIYLSIS